MGKSQNAASGETVLQFMPRNDGSVDFWIPGAVRNRSDASVSYAPDRIGRVTASGRIRDLANVRRSGEFNLLESSMNLTSNGTAWLYVKELRGTGTETRRAARQRLIQISRSGRVKELEVALPGRIGRRGNVTFMFSPDSTAGLWYRGDVLRGDKYAFGRVSLSGAVTNKAVLNIKRRSGAIVQKDEFAPFLQLAAGVPVNDGERGSWLWQGTAIRLPGPHGLRWQSVPAWTPAQMKSVFGTVGFTYGGVPAADGRYWSVESKNASDGQSLQLVATQSDGAQTLVSVPDLRPTPRVGADGSIWLVAGKSAINVSP